MRLQVPRAHTQHTHAPLGVFHVRREAERKEPFDLHAAQVRRHRACACVCDGTVGWATVFYAASPESDELTLTKSRCSPQKFFLPFALLV